MGDDLQTQSQGGRNTPRVAEGRLFFRPLLRNFSFIYLSISLRVLVYVCMCVRGGGEQDSFLVSFYFFKKHLFC